MSRPVTITLVYSDGQTSTHDWGDFADELLNQVGGAKAIDPATGVEHDMTPREIIDRVLSDTFKTLIVRDAANVA